MNSPKKAPQPATPDNVVALRQPAEIAVIGPIPEIPHDTEFKPFIWTLLTS